MIYFLKKIMSQRLSSKQPRTNLSTEQKVAFLLLLFLGIGGIILGFRSFGSNLSRPFDLQIAEYAGEVFLTSSEQSDLEKEEQKTKDTDEDGLSDYDELYVFKTSPYLSDTDSDGFDDYTEVYSNNDPTCPIGTDCESVAASLEGAGSGTTAEEILETFSPTTGSEDLSVYEELVGSDISSEQDVVQYFESMSLEETRELLLEAGLSQEQLDQISDEMLQELFNTALVEASAEITTE
mgnify:CR=1 FL=1